MRPIDLARRAEVSTQTVRNLEAAGVLPAADRTPSGYRTYTEAHLSALLTYRALSTGHGSTAAQDIMAAVVRGDPGRALALVDAGHASVHDQRRSLAETEAALSAVAEQHPGGAHPSGMRVGELAHRLGVRTSALRVWEDAGLLLPARQRGTGYRVYSAEDVRDAQIIHLLRQGGYLFDRIRPVVDDIRGAGGTDALHAALAERRTALRARSRAMVAGAACFHAHLDTHGV